MCQILRSMCQIQILHFLCIIVFPFLHAPIFFTFLCYTCVFFMCNNLWSLCFVLLPWFPIFFHTTILIVHEPFDIVINFFLRIIIKELNQRFILPYLLRLCTTIFYTLLNFIIASYSPLNLKCDLF